MRVRVRVRLRVLATSAISAFGIVSVSVHAVVSSISWSIS